MGGNVPQFAQRHLDAAAIHTGQLPLVMPGGGRWKTIKEQLKTAAGDFR